MKLAQCIIIKIVSIEYKISHGDKFWALSFFMFVLA